MATASKALPERLYSLRELQDAGYGHRRTLMTRIGEGVLPAHRVGNAYRVRESDLHLLASPAMPATDSTAENKLDVLVKDIVDNFPKLNPEQKAELGRLLAPAA